MKFVGIDLHKQSISLCVVDQTGAVLNRKRFSCAQPQAIRQFFAELGSFQAVVEATASYEWLWQLIEPLADRPIPAHPQKLRVIAEIPSSTVVQMNGGVLRTMFHGDPGFPGIPNGWLSASVPSALCSNKQRLESNS